MGISGRFALAALTLSIAVSFAHWARAADLDGAWAQDPSVELDEQDG
jgi:hypothetical protein